jgi:diguanylate cyclase (GGDEF)-like protein
MVPLLVEQSCLKCHSKQGYKLGDIRGGISVTFDITDVEKSLTKNKMIIIALAVITTLSFILIVYAFTFVLKKNLDRAQEKIKELVITDELTGLHNRRYLFLKLKDEIKRGERLKISLGCMLIDIDFFKNINDKHGHLAGDMILENISLAIKACCRETDTVARYGGEEIAVLMPGTDMKGAAHVAERTRNAIEELRSVYDQDVVIPVTVSIGVASYSHDELKRFVDSDQVIRYVDEALYRAKEKGRNRVEVAKGVFV